MMAELMVLVAELIGIPLIVNCAFWSRRRLAEIESTGR